MSPTAGSGIRINRFLASCGVESRRGCDRLVREGRVEVNGTIISDLATRVQPTDHVRCDGKLLRPQPPLTVVLNKPIGYICTHLDPEGRKTIYDLLPAKFNTLNYIGRLDQNSSGLILLTTSGDLAESLTHPRYHIEKEYLVHLERPFPPELTHHLLEGIPIMEGLAKAESVHFESRRKLRMVLTQGYNRQIRRMFSKMENKVRKLERIRIGNLIMPGLSTGEYHILNHREIEEASRNPK